MKLKLNIQKSENFNQRRYRELLKRLKWAYLDNGGERGTWREYANSKGIYYSLKTYLDEVTCEDDLQKIFDGIYVSKGGKK